MSFVSRILVALVIVGLIWVFWPFGGDEAAKHNAPDGQLFTKPLPEPKPTEHPKPSLPGGPKSDGTRTAAVAPDAMPSTAPKPKLEPKRFYRVVVREGGTLEAGKAVIQLQGIEGRAANAKCKDARGQSWACGARARAALIRLIRGRAVTCDIPKSGNRTKLKARCTVGGSDLSVWMVRHGWAKPSKQGDEEITGAAKTARKQKIGIWR